MNHSFYQEMSDEQLFILVKNDDRHAFDEIYHRYWSFLLDFAYRPLQCRRTAEDIVQEIFVSLYQRAKSIDLVVSLKAYLCKALKFKVLNEYRSKAVRNNYKKNVFFVEQSKNDFANQVETRELKTVIDNSIGNLPDKCRQAFLLSRQENLSYKDISAELDISVSTVEKHISKALKSIKTNLNTYL